MDSETGSVQFEPGTPTSSRRRRHRSKHGSSRRRRELIRNIIVGFIGAAICAGTYYYWQSLTLTR